MEASFLDCLYGAVLDPSQWVQVLERLADLVGGGSGWLSMRHASGGGGYVSRMNPAVQDLYFTSFSGEDPLSLRFDEPYGRPVLTDEDRLPKEALLRTGFYNDFMRRADANSVLIIDLGTDQGVRGAVHINRTLGQGQFDSHDIGRARRLRSHLVRAARLADRFGKAIARAERSVLAPEEEQAPLLIVEPDGRLEHANRNGARLLDGTSDLRVKNGRLAAATPAVASRLDAVIAQAGAADPAKRRAATMAFGQGGRQSSHRLMSAPAERWPGGGAGPRAVVLTAQPAHTMPATPAGLLASRFSLTPAEIRVALLLLDGYTVSDVASRLQTSHHTVRSQLRSVFAKTDVSRQSELVRLLLPLVHGRDV